MIAGSDHVELRVRDLDQALSFYKGCLGLVDHTPESRTHVLGSQAGAFLVLVAGRSNAADRAGGASDHLAFSVADVEKAKGRLREDGVEIVSERKDSDGQGKSYYFRDPDGNVLEIYGPVAQPS
ncbi:MAG: VOC family protein [Acidiferrobacterales bacterium]